MPEPAGIRDLHVVQVVATTTGGTGAHVRMLVERLVADGARVTVCCPPDVARRFDFGALGVRTVDVAIGSRPSRRDGSTVGTIRAIAEDADVLHAHGLRAGSLAGLAVGKAARRRAPLVVTWHNAILATGLAALTSALLERFVARRADLTLCVSPDLVDRVRSLGGQHVELLAVSAPPLLPAQRSREDVRGELGAGDRAVVLTIARLHRQKGYAVLVHAAALLTTMSPTPLFVAAGDGPARDEIEALIEQSGAPLRLLGQRTDVADLIAAADVMVLPSIWEGSPLAVQEALRAGLPFVGTTAGGVPSLVGDGGLLVPPGDVEALAAAIESVVGDPQARAEWSGRALLAAARLPTDDAVAVRIEQVYVDLAKAGTT